MGVKMDEAGRILKTCERCGRVMRIDDYYAGIRRKYCPQCSDDVARAQRADYMARMRAKARERRAMEREKARLLADENEMLRRALAELRARIAELGE